jgi:hypothetical protein
VANVLSACNEEVENRITGTECISFMLLILVSVSLPFNRGILMSRIIKQG